MEREESAAALDTFAKTVRLLRGRAYIAGVGNDGVCGPDDVSVGEILVDAASDAVVSAEQLQDLQPRIVEVMPAAAAHEGDVDPARLATGRDRHARLAVRLLW